MSIYSLVKAHHTLEIVEVEVQLVRGLPQLHILGRPEASLKECALRLKTAFQNAGWEWPRHQQIIVNLKPTSIKKQSSGLDLAIALGIRRAQGKLKLTDLPPQPICFAQVDLTGSIAAPAELSQWEGLSGYSVITGVGGGFYPFSLFEMTELSSPLCLTERPARLLREILHRPELRQARFSSGASELLAVAAAGEHSVLLAGAAGAGKSYWSETLWSLLPSPQEEEFRKSYALYQSRKKVMRWRPFVQPHHTASALAMVGGGVPPRAGAFSLAHGGLLVLDEYLEFSRTVQEALREPMEKGEVHLHRGSEMLTLPSRFQLVATTNLCPCGEFEPGALTSCRMSLRKCQSYLERLSGPVVDRFDLLSFTAHWREKTVDTNAILERIERAVEFRKKRFQALPNGRLESREIESQISSDLKMLFPTEFGSQRRYRSFLRVLRTLADLEGRSVPTRGDLNKALDLTWYNFEKLKRGQM